MITSHNMAPKKMPRNNPSILPRNSTCLSVSLLGSKENIKFLKSSFRIRLSRPLRRSCADLLSRIHSGVKKLRRPGPERLPPWSSRLTTAWRLSIALHTSLELLPWAGFGIILSGNFSIIAFNFFDCNLLHFIAFDKIFFTTCQAKVEMSCSWHTLDIVVLNPREPKYCMKGKQTKVAVSFTPERYRMIFCPICSGKGYLERSHGDREVCRMCRGFGLIRKEKFRIQQTQK